MGNKIFNFLSSCPSEQIKDPKISNLITSSMSNATPSIDTSKKKNKTLETIDFLHFIRYMSIIYKSDLQIRLKFLYGIAINDTENKIKIYDNIFNHLKRYSLATIASTKNTNETTTTTTTRQRNETIGVSYSSQNIDDIKINDLNIKQRASTVNRMNKDHKDDNIEQQLMPLMNQDEFIEFWRIIYNLFVNMDNEADMYHSAATVSTILLKLGEATRKYQDKEQEELTFNTTTSNNSPNKWSIKFEQLLASLLTETLLVDYFEIKYDLDEKLIDYKSRHA
jgi:hypothetical protein